MSERGGTTTQSGIIYQNSVAALYLGRLCDSAERPLSEQVVNVRAEAPVHVDDTVITFADGHREYIQAKENLSKSDEAWAKLWQDFERQFDSAEFEKEKDKLTLQIGFPQKEHHFLTEICDRAITSLDFEEWLERLSKEQRQILENIKLNFLLHQSDNKYLFSLLKRLRISIFSLYQIEKDVLYYWIPRSNKLPIEFFRLLRDRVGGEARRRGIFTAPELVKSLKEESNIELSAPPTVEQLSEITKKCGAGLRQHKNSFGNTKIHLERKITDDITAWVNEKTEKNVAIILDQAGMGKTVVMRDVLEALDQQNVSVLAFKADQLSGVKSKEDFQNKLGLPDEIERVLTRLAERRQTICIIDQIDALSLSLAHDQTTLDVLLDIIAKTRFIQNLKILISCRVFDFKTDPRLAKIETDRTFHISGLLDEEVKTVVEKAGLSFDNLSPTTKKLLKTPLHLDLFMLSSRLSDEINISNPLHTPIELNSLQDLYSLLWQSVICRTDLRAPSKTTREEVLELVTSEMNRKQRVSVPQALVIKSGNEELIAAATWLASHGILVPYKNEWNLIHQTFFDYCYAKNFVENDNNLYETVLTGDQGLFVRPQIIQILSYLRSVDSETYRLELNQFLFKTEIRFHLRDHVLRWFAALPNPTDEEWELARRVMQYPEQKKRLLTFMSGNTAWFKYLKPILIRGLEIQNEVTLDNETIPFLTSFAEAEQSEIAKMLRPYLNRSEAWDNRIHYVLTAVRDWREKDAVDLFEEYFNNTSVIERIDYFELKRIANFDQRAACRFTVRLLNIIVDQTINNARQNGANYIYSIDYELEALNGGSISEVLESLVENEAEYFLEQIIPWLERVLDFAYPESNDNFPYFKSDPLSHFWDSGVYAVHHQLIQSIIKSLTKLAESDSQLFLKQIKKIAALDYQTPQRLVVRVFTKLPEKYAAEAFNYLVHDTRRLYLGESQVFESRTLLKAIVPFLTEEETSEIEKGILLLSAPATFERLEELEYRHINQMFLFQSFPQDKLSLGARRRLGELERKFPNAKAFEAPSPIISDFVGSPISSEAVKKMSNKAWFRAIKKYEKGYRHKASFRGGAGQLAGSLIERIKEQPERFYNLALRLSIEIDSAYVSAFINGLTDSQIETSKVFDVARHLLKRKDRDQIRTIAWALDKREKKNFPDDLLENLKEYLQLPMGEDETWWERQENNQHNQGYYDGVNQGPYSSYFNSVRGAVFHLIMRILTARNNTQSVEQRWEMIEFALSDESIALKAGAIEELIYMLNHDHEKSVNLYEQLSEQHASLLDIRYSLDFLFYALPKHYSKLKRFLILAMNEKHESTQQRAAELACLAPFYSEITNNEEILADATKLANSTLTGQSTWRRGAAKIYTYNINSPKHTRVCLENLTKLLDDSDEQVRRIVARVFEKFNEEILQKVKGFVIAYASLDIPMEGEHTLTKFLWEYGTLAPEWSLSVVNTLLVNRYKMNIPSYHRSGEYLIRLILRIYSDPSLTQNTQEAALDTFDSLMQNFPGDTIRVLNEWDRR